MPAIRLRHHDLTSFGAFASRLKVGLDSTVRRNRSVAAARVAGALLPGASALFGPDASQAATAASAAVESLARARSALRDGHRPPLAITVDEAGLLDKRHADVLVQVHEAVLDWPILPVLAGTYGVRRAMKEAGVYRLARDRDIRLGRLPEREARLALPALCDRFGIGVAADEAERWAERIAADSHGFPQHLNVGLVSAAEEWLEANEQGRAPNIEQAAGRAALRRDDYYRGRLGSVLPRHGPALVAAVETVRQCAEGGARVNDVEAAFRAASDKDRSTSRLPPLPMEEVSRLMNRAMENGVFQPTSAGTLELSIPSMGDFIERTYGEHKRGSVGQ